MSDFLCKWANLFVVGLGLRLMFCMIVPQAHAQDQSHAPAKFNEQPKTPSTSKELTEVARAGKAVVVSREGQCTLCHQIPDYSGAMGDLGPALSGVASRLSSEALELRVKDSRRLNPYTIMPPYFSTEGLNQVDPKFKGQTLLSETQLHQVLTYLSTLR